MKTQENSTTSLPFPPWGAAEAWMEAVDATAFALNNLKNGAREALRIHSRRIRLMYERLFPAMDAVGDATCTSCPTPCCITAKPWFDVKDLLFFHLEHIPAPPHQTISDPAETCRYLTEKGCALPRQSRPFICTWYICPEQKNLWKNHTKHPRGIIKGVLPYHEADALISSLKKNRNTLEDGFIKAVTAV